jgi:hypothetical protein
MDLIKDFHTPDKRWGIWNIRAHEDFVKNFMVSGKFHGKVPPQIVEEYNIVERLICYSYYHYPLIDEAFAKATRIFEIAVNLKLKELNIPKTKGYEPLNSKIKKIASYTSPSLITEWEKARKVRNIFAHPEPGKLAGIIVVRGFYQMVNILNLMFIDKIEIEENENLLDDLKRKAEPLKKGLFILDIENNPNKYLIWSVIPYSLFKINNIEKSFWVFHPVFKNFPQTTEELVFDQPFYLNLKDVIITDYSLVGRTTNTKKEVKVIPTLDQNHVALLKKHNKIVLSSQIEVKQNYWTYLETEISFELVKFLYNECWQ